MAGEGRAFDGAKQGAGAGGELNVPILLPWASSSIATRSMFFKS